MIADCRDKLRVRGLGGDSRHGFDPMADRGKPPFEKFDSTLKLGEALGVGTRDLSRIEVVGTPIANAQFKFPAISTLKTWIEPGSNSLMGSLGENAPAPPGSSPMN